MAATEYSKDWATSLVSHMLNLIDIDTDFDHPAATKHADNTSLWAQSCPIPLPTPVAVDAATSKSQLRKAQIQDAAWSLVWSLTIVHVKDRCMGSVDKFTAQAEALLDHMLLWLEAQEHASRYRTLFLKTLDQVIQVSSLASCTSLLAYVSTNVGRIKRLIFVKSENDDDFVEERRNLIGMSTNLLKRVSPLLNSELVSAIQLLNSQLLDANASVLNPRCACNELSLPVPETTLPTDPGAHHLNQIYTQLWQLLGNMHDPRTVLRESAPAEPGKVRESLKAVTAAMDKLVLEFSRVASVAKEHLRNPAKEKLLEPVSRDFFCPKYLTSRELFDAQIKDPLFRRQVLVHFLIKCEVLLFYSEDRVKEYDAVFSKPGARRNKSILPEKFPWLTAAEADDIKLIRSRIIIVLSRIPPNGSAFVEAIIQLLREEASWMFWKARFMQPMFDKVPPQLAEPAAYQPPMLAESAEVWLGNARLDSMWKPVASHIADELSDPDLEQWTSQLDEEIQGDIEREYQLSRKEQWKWQTYRLYLRHHFHTMTAPTTHHPLRDMVRRAAGHPDLTATELADIREREREAAELRRQMELERQAAEAEERARIQREREEQERVQREREEKARVDKEERERKERDDRERRAREEQEWRAKEERERKTRDELERKQREEREREAAAKRKLEEEAAAARRKVEEEEAATRRKAADEAEAARRKAAAAELGEKRRQLKLSEEEDARKRELAKDENEARKKKDAEEAAARPSAAKSEEQREADIRAMEERKRRFARETYSAVPTMSSLAQPAHQQQQPSTSSSSSSAASRSPARAKSTRSPTRASAPTVPSMPSAGPRGGRDHHAGGTGFHGIDDDRHRRIQDAGEAERKRRLAESEAARRKLEESRATSVTSTSPVDQQRPLPTADVDMVDVDAIQSDRESPPPPPSAGSEKPIPADLMAARLVDKTRDDRERTSRNEIPSKSTADAGSVADARALISGRANRDRPPTPSREKSDGGRSADGGRRDGDSGRDARDRNKTSDLTRDQRRGGGGGTQSQPQDRDRRDRVSSPPRQSSDLDRRLGGRLNDTRANQGAQPDPPSRSGSSSGPSSRIQSRLGSPPPASAAPAASAGRGNIDTPGREAGSSAAQDRNPRDRSRDRRGGDRNSRRDDGAPANDRDVDRERDRDRGDRGQQQVQIALLPRNERGRGARRATPDVSDPDLASTLSSSSASAGPSSARGGGAASAAGGGAASAAGGLAAGQSPGLFSRLTAGLGGNESPGESSSSASAPRRDGPDSRRQGGGETFTAIPYMGDRDRDRDRERERDRDRGDRGDRMREEDRRDSWSASGGGGGGGGNNGGGGGGRGGQKRRNDSYRDGRDRNKRHRP